MTSSTAAGDATRATNVVIVLVDDMGFGGPSTFGGPCATPTAERLANDGLRFNQFHVNALCAPTRQSLMTGRNCHAVGMGTLPDFATSEPGYTAIRPASAGTLAQVLSAHGYATGAFGKMHQTPLTETGPAGPFDRWPTHEGFDRFYGFLGAEMDHWNPLLFDDVEPVEPNQPQRLGYHLTEDLADRAIEWVSEQTRADRQRPFFLYFSLGACHSPLHVPDRYRDRYRGRFAHGWNRQREITLARQQELGVVPPDARLSPWAPTVPLWDDLSADEQRVAAAFMEVYAAVAEHADAQVGRLVAAIEELGELDNTLLLYLQGDNGAAAEGGRLGTLNAQRQYNGMEDGVEYLLEHLDTLGGPESYPLHPAGWGHAMNTPFPWSKMVASHFGGTRDGLVVHWPAGIPARGELRAQWHHVVDLFPTVLEVAGIEAPAIVDGAEQAPRDGISMAYTFADGDAPDRRTTQYFETMGNRAIYDRGWIASIMHVGPTMPPDQPMRAFDDEQWELYDLAHDWSQGVDVAAAHPRAVAALARLFESEAARNQVFPLDDTFTPLDPPGRPLTAMTLLPGMTRIPEDLVLDLKGRSHRVEAVVSVADAPARGVIVAQGGRFGGWALHVVAGRPVYTYNHLGLWQVDLAAPHPLPAGRHVIAAEIAHEGDSAGGPATVSLQVGDRVVARAHLDATTPIVFSTVETCGVGVDLGTPVSSAYAEAADTVFVGEIAQVELSLVTPA